MPGGRYYSKDNFLNVKPGTHREYSNIAAGLAGYIVEVAVGMKLNVYAKQHIFTPLRMSNTGWFLSEVDPAKHSKLYVAQNGSTIPIPLYELTTYPDGGVRTSVSDLSKFFIALLNDGVYEGTRILDKRWVEEMLRFQYTESNKPANVSLRGSQLRALLANQIQRHTNRTRRIRSRGEDRDACEPLEGYRRDSVHEHLAVWRRRCATTSPSSVSSGSTPKH